VMVKARLGRTNAERFEFIANCFHANAPGDSE
jgi:hypothetical protein